MSVPVRALALILGLSLAGPLPVQPSAAAATRDTPAAGNRRCDAAQRRVAKEERALAAADESLSTNREARKSCGDRTICARYDRAIGSMEARKARHDTRLAKYRSEADEACKSG